VENLAERGPPATVQGHQTTLEKNVRNAGELC